MWTVDHFLLVPVASGRMIAISALWVEGAADVESAGFVQ